MKVGLVYWEKGREVLVIFVWGGFAGVCVLRTGAMGEQIFAILAMRFIYSRTVVVSLSGSCVKSFIDS